MVEVDTIKQRIKSSLPFVSAVVFSGGEPTRQQEQLIELCKYSKELGLYVGVETNGFYPCGLRAIKPYVDKVFLDIKAPVNSPYWYYKATKHLNAYENINITLKLNLPIEIRIVDIDKAKTESIVKSIDACHKVTILPYRKPQ